MLHGLPYGQLSFILKAGSDTLPHPLNLRRWKIQCDSKCPLCHSLRPTTAHILNGCPTALDQGRYTWRHDSALKKILQGIILLLRNDSKLYADIDQWRAEDTPPSTIPPNILSTSSRPDIVIVNSLSKQIHLLELTIPTNSQKGLDQARERKLNKPKYNYLISDLKVIGWSPSYDTIEIESLGHLPSSSLEATSHIVSPDSSSSITSILLESAKVVIACSHQIFLAHKQITWSSFRPMIN